MVELAHLSCLVTLQSSQLIEDNMVRFVVGFEPTSGCYQILSMDVIIQVNMVQ